MCCCDPLGNLFVSAPSEQYNFLANFWLNKRKGRAFRVEAEFCTQRFSAETGDFRLCTYRPSFCCFFLYFFCLFVVFQFSIFNWSPQGSKAIFAFYLSDSLLVHSGASLSSSAALVARAVIGTDVALRIVLCGASSGMILEIEF